MSVRLIIGDCRLALVQLVLASVQVDAIITDPPYHLTSIYKRFAKDGGASRKASPAGPYRRHAKGFMGQTWDGGDVASDKKVWSACLQLLKPGGHLIAFGGRTTYHRMACAIEDAGFEMRDMLIWRYLNGFPKSHDAGDGWGTGLKPETEPLVLARVPILGTVANNRKLFGTGPINIDGVRVSDRWPSNVINHPKADKKSRHGSDHPTVKPVGLMRYLCKLIVPAGGTVLDPFAGTGTTAEAAVDLDLNCILIEREARYVEDVRRRLKRTAGLILDLNVERMNDRPQTDLPKIAPADADRKLGSRKATAAKLNRARDARDQ